MDKIYYILNLGGGKEMPPLEQHIGDNDPYLLVNVDKSYFSGFTPKQVESYYRNFEQNQLVYDCECDVFEFMERTKIKFDIVFIHRFFEHINRDKLLYFIYLLSTITIKDSVIDLISPNYQLLAQMLLDERPQDDPDFDKKNIILSTELFNEPSDPHNNITTPARLRMLFTYEGRFDIMKTENPYNFDGRNIYFRLTVRRSQN